MTDKIEVPRELLEELRDCAMNCEYEYRGEGYKQKAEQADALLREAAQSECWCEACRPVTFEGMRMPLCPVCGNKRCPRSLDHRNACNNSNAPDQVAHPCCNNPAQCWEPCGDLGKSAEHARPEPADEELTRLRKDIDNAMKSARTMYHIEGSMYHEGRRVAYNQCLDWIDAAIATTQTTTKE